MLLVFGNPKNTVCLELQALQTQDFSVFDDPHRKRPMRKCCAHTQSLRKVCAVRKVYFLEFPQFSRLAQPLH